MPSAFGAASLTPPLQSYNPLTGLSPFALRQPAALRPFQSSTEWSRAGRAPPAQASIPQPSGPPPPQLGPLLMQRLPPGASGQARAGGYVAPPPPPRESHAEAAARAARVGAMAGQQAAYAAVNASLQRSALSPTPHALLWGAQPGMQRGPACVQLPRGAGPAHQGQVSRVPLPAACASGDAFPRDWDISMLPGLDDPLRGKGGMLGMSTTSDIVLARVLIKA